uniref:Salivary serine protease n=1 Tax=Simulium vittatum TaxID=7192 RepID=B5M0Q5_SIMVI|nr:salivary serine protease [Simulium vittatum]
MKIVLILCSIAAVATAQGDTVSASLPIRRPIVRLVNGHRAATGEFPFSGLLFGGGVMCSCTLIKADRVLTAGHCVASKQPGYVFFGSANRGDGNEVVNFYNDILLHPNYLSSGRQAGFDIAVLRLVRPYELGKNINIAHLPTGPNNSFEGQLAWATGYGLVNNGQSPDYLMKAQMTVMDRNQCHRWYSAPNDDKLVCGKSQASICSGDSGGGLTLRNQGVWRVIGVASVKLVISSDGCNPVVPNGYVRVSEHLDFIKSVL